MKSVLDIYPRRVIYNRVLYYLDISISIHAKIRHKLYNSQ